MSFCDAAFIFAFAPIAITIYWLLPSRFRLAWLALANYVFYAWWDWRFCLAILVITCVDYATGRLIAGARTRGMAKLGVTLSLVTDLGLLGFFKYAGFTADSINTALAALGLDPAIPVLHLVLPVGISFYIFQSLSYTLDLYYGRVKPAANLLHYATFVSMFTQLVAGPIVRFSQLGDQLLNLPPRLDARRLNLGLVLFCSGLIKKVLIADWLAHFVDPLWLNWRSLLPGEAAAAALGFAVQLYFDFAGYSLMAIGLGLLLGLQLPQNFNSPYRASDIGDFWRRWHMTLSFWMRDYVFLRIGGLRLNGRWLALAATMLLTGLWHGAAWTYVLWGAYHGLLLLCHHALRARRIRWRGGGWGQAGTLVMVVVGWVLFRADSLPSALWVFRTVFDVTRWRIPTVLPPAFLALLVFALAWSIFAPNLYELLVTRQVQPRRWALVALGLLAAVAIMLTSQSGPFLYYQF